MLITLIALITLKGDFRYGKVCEKGDAAGNSNFYRAISRHYSRNSYDGTGSIREQLYYSFRNDLFEFTKMDCDASSIFLDNVGRNLN